uniref:Transmembrane protein 222 n=2 Tax=Lygus hesperus TaxID=30085 RepID=A0A146LYE8_LYGHE
MAYNGPGYIDVTQPRPLKPDEETILSAEELRGREMPRYHSQSAEGHSPRYPHCIVWTPIPLITYIFPFIGHMGICKANGVIRDFAASYYVSEDNMAFGQPTKIVQLDPSKVKGTIDWDTAIEEAAQVYEHRMHNLCCDNCHSMVALALNKMQYNGKTNWNMVSVWGLFVCRGKYLGWGGAVKTLLPFFILVFIIALVYVALRFVFHNKMGVTGL